MTFEMTFKKRQKTNRVFYNTLFLGKIYNI